MNRQYYVVGPGPLSIRAWDGKPCSNYPVKGCYGIAWNDQDGPRLLNGRSYRTRHEAQLEADRGDGD